MIQIFISQSISKKLKEINDELLVKLILCSKISKKKYIIKELGLKAMLLAKNFGLFANILRQKRIASSKKRFFNIFMYYIQ